MAISPDGRRAYAVGPATSQLYAIDVEKRRVLKSISAGKRAHGVTVSPDGQTVWIADWTGTVSMFDAETLDLVTEIAVAETGGTEAAGATHIAFSRDGNQVYVSGIGEVTGVAGDCQGAHTHLPLGIGAVKAHEASCRRAGYW